MGVGKTTIGRQLARALSKSFYDSDHEIEKYTGVSIPLIFEIEGEKSFRKRESRILQRLVPLDNIVLATGGGVVIEEGNRQLLNENGFLVYLRSTPEKIYRRTAGDKKRPLLQKTDKMAQIRELLEEREPLYTGLADVTIETGNLAVNSILKKILSKSGN